MAVINGDNQPNKYLGPFESGTSDPLIGTFLGDTINGFGGADDLIGLGGSDFLYGGTEGDDISGGTGSDTLDGGSGDDFLRGGGGADRIDGGTGSDTLVFGRAGGYSSDLTGLSDNTSSDAGVTVTLASTNSGSGGTGRFGDAEGDTYTSIANVIGTESRDVITGTNGRFVGTFPSGGLTVVDGNNILDGRGGDDALSGKGGDDTLRGGTGRDSLLGGSGKDSLWGGDDNDTLIGGSGADKISGGNGIDTVSYSDSAAGVTVSLAGGIGRGGDAEGDEIRAFAGRELSPADWVENAVGSAFADILYGNELVNTLTGNGGNDALFGGAGADTLYGDDLFGAGNDTLEGGAGADRLIGGFGIDTASYLGSASGVLVNLATGAANGGDASGDTFGDIENVTGSDHNDELHAAVNFNFDGSRFGSTLNGARGNDALYGGDANDTLNGGLGADRLYGGKGDDVIYVDAGDLVFEAADAGTDTVITEVSFSLSDVQHIETVKTFSPFSTAAINLSGNTFANTLEGNSGANLLSGGGGADTLNGGAGADRLIGGTGDDAFVVDNAGDLVFEASGGGVDRVFASTSYALQAGQEIEALQLLASTGSAGLNLTGNEISQSLVGNNGANVINGGVGRDAMTGRGGGDTYIVDNLGDRITEAAGGGRDTVLASASYVLGEGQEIEALQLLASTGSARFNLSGNAFGQSLVGNSGANVLDGRGGGDVLTGRGGADSFVFSTALGAGNVDRIADFAAEDTVRLSKDVFSALAPGQLAESAFKNISTGTADANDRILYKQTTGELFYDADGSGSGAAMKFAVLDNKAALTAADFLVA
ncbi:Ca2+-binding RTX toxin-like protein [Methylorubrum rhodinum]|uniref:Ca2+-binding RTX toxin-like protein n=1 Tax=Methylorubrum rhodinum TaxID=29428 RepID=A0A840ZEU8_9HYPH|nr:calcium-binding protein [Methylorubrum rhodinum]MBB5756462.1 Ca2+-binding RTX toxin-like protein [Methylorubrum rhodinum]